MNKKTITNLVQYFSKVIPLVGVLYIVLGSRAILILTSTNVAPPYISAIAGLFFIFMGFCLMKFYKWPLYVVSGMEVITLLGTFILYSSNRPVAGPIVANVIQIFIISLLFFNRKHFRTR